MTDGRFVTFACRQPRLTVVAIVGQTPPVPADGYGGWNLINRPRRKALTEWDGINPLRVLVPVILGVKPGRGGVADGRALNISCAPDRLALERMAMPPAVGAEPPQISVSGPVPHATSGPWVIESFDWDQAPIYNAAGVLVRHAVTVHLLEYVRDDRLALDLNAAAHARRSSTTKSASAARTAGGSSNQATRQKVYVVRAGDTLSSIAARVLGNYKRWTEIASLNSIRDPKSIAIGQKLRLP